MAKLLRTIVFVATLFVGLFSLFAGVGRAAPGPSSARSVSALPAQVATPQAPTPPSVPVTPSTSTPVTNNGSGNVSVNLGNSLSKPSQSVTIIVVLTLLTVAPSLLIMLTSFTRVIIVLSLTRNALGLQSVPPNQVIAGMALFLTLFIMSPVLTQVNKDGIQPYLHGQKTQQQAYNDGVAPLRTWMLKQTRTDNLALFTDAKNKPASPDKVSMTSLIPAFILSEVKTAFIIGFVIFIPFLVIDLIVSSSLMSMGMMMLPPVLVSLPFKILLFVLVDGWALIVKSLLTSFH